MKTKKTMIYWKGEKLWLGKLIEHPYIMTQGRSLKELEENIKEAYLLMLPKKAKMRQVTLIHIGISSISITTT